MVILTMQHPRWPPAENRFNASFAKNDETGCWLWTRPLHPTGGYAQFSLNGRREYAHRASWIMFRGPIPAGMLVCHSCDVRHCVNPDHLFLGTAQDNTDDMLAKGRKKLVGGSMPGERNPGAKLTDELVVHARRQCRAGKTIDEIGAELGVTRSAAHLAIRGKTWGHVTQEPPVGPVYAQRARVA